MSRKLPLRTYQRKNARQGTSAGNQSSMIRENISKNKKQQPAEFLAFKDSDHSLEYDPFDTTFDRLVRETKKQPLIPVQADDLSYSSSSDDEKPVTMPPPSPLINPRPMIQRRGYKKHKSNHEAASVVGKKFRWPGESLKMFDNDSSMDENNEPNIEPTRSRNRMKKRKNAIEPKNIAIKKKRRVVEKLVLSISREKIVKNIDMSNGLKNCTVNLTRIPLDKSITALRLENEIVDDEQISEKSVVQDISEINAKTESKNNTNIKPVEETNTSILKNPIVSLTRLKVPQLRQSVANKSWLSSTPIDRKINLKSTIRLSPIANERSMEITKRYENYDYNEKILAQSTDFTPKNLKITKPSNLIGHLMKNTIKNSLRVLSVSTDPEPSSLLFDDTEIPPPLTDSLIPLVENKNSVVVDVSTIIPLKGFVQETAASSPISEESRHVVRAVLPPIENHKNTTDISLGSPFKGFTKESTDSGSLHLTFSGSDNTAESSKEITRTRDKKRSDSRASSASNQKPMDVTDTVSFKGFTEDEQNVSGESVNILQSTSKESAKDRQNISTDSAEDVEDYSMEVDEDPTNITQENIEDLQNNSHENDEDLKNNSDESYEDFQNNSQESVEDLKNNSQESVEDLKNNSHETVEDFQNNSQESGEDLQNNSHESVEDLQNNSQESVEDLQNNSHESSEDLQNNSHESGEDLKNISHESVEDLQNNSQESVEDLQNNSHESSEDLQNNSHESGEDLKNISHESVEDLENLSEDSVENALNNTQKDDKDAQIISKKSVKNLQKISKKSVKDLQKISKKSVKDLQKISKKSVKDLQKISNKIAKDSKENSVKSDVEDEWATTSIYPSSDASIEEIPIMTSIDSTKGESIVQINSDDSESCMDIGEFVDVSENLMEIKDDSHGSWSLKMEKSKIDESMQSIVQKSSVVVTMGEENLRQAFNRRSKQPIVLLSRLSVPVKRSSKILTIKNTQPQSPAKTRKSIRNTRLKNDNENIKKLSNVSQTDSELMELGDDENEESQTSQDDMESLKIDEVSDVTSEVEQSPIKQPDRDSEKGSFRWTMTEVGNSSDVSLDKDVVDDTRNDLGSFDSLDASVEMSETEKMLSKMFDESDESHEDSVKKSRVEIKTVKKLDKDAPEDSLRSNQPIVLLTPLEDSTRITERRKKYHNWGLSVINENLVTNNITTIEEEPDELQTVDTTKENIVDKELQIKLIRDDWTSSQSTKTSCDVSITTSQEHDSMKEDKIVYLKPGKSWSRSLSLYRQVHTQDDLEFLAFNKGKKWRQSVQGMLDMQLQGVIQSCVKKNEDDTKSRSSYRIRNSAATLWTPGSSQPDTSRVFSQSSVGSPGRFVRRVSIRVVPDRKNSELYEDSPFLEAYGITSSENRKTLGKRSTLIAPRASTLHVYNVHCADVTFDSIPKSLNSVTSRDVVLAQCCQESSLVFNECYPDLYLQQCSKIGEGVFGEVFLYEKGAAKSVIKIIPIEGDLKVNGERQKKFDEILSEIVIAKELNNLRYGDSSKTSSFVEVKNIRCVVGKYPTKLIDLWKTYDDEKNSENDCPDMFDKNQLYIVLELGHGGQDLEAFVFQNSSETHAIFIQTALALAVAEESLEFEHRDLHWGNVLISRTDDSHVTYKLRDRDISVVSKGVKVSVIDFTLSRMSYQGCSIFNDLSLDDDLFAAQGEYQFEIYRLMRQKVENNWQKFEPYTNVLWLHYTLDKMITAARYRRTSSKIHKKTIGKLQELKAEILNYKSAFDFVTNCDNMTRLQGSRSSTTTAETAD